MPPKEPCPICGVLVPDWHREWHTHEDQVKLFQGRAAMECPRCGGAVMHGNWLIPLSAPVTSVEKVQRDVLLAALWASLSGKQLVDYLKTAEGQPYQRYWSDAEVLQADSSAATNPKSP